MADLKKLEAAFAVYHADLAADRDNARRACAAVRADYKSVLIEIENEINLPRVSPRGKQKRLDTVLSIIKRARKRVDL